MLPLYTKGGNPSSHLVHAEQQVLDWLAWTEANAEYARKKLPGLKNPIGYIVIGRDSSLSSSSRDKLNRRNAALRGTMVIMTYDDLVRRAEAILKILQMRGAAGVKLARVRKRRKS